MASHFITEEPEFFDNGAAAFERRSQRAADLKEQRIALLEEKLGRKNEVLAEPMEGHIHLRKGLGAP